MKHTELYHPSEHEMHIYTSIANVSVKLGAGVWVETTCHDECDGQTLHFGVVHKTNAFIYIHICPFVLFSASIDMKKNTHIRKTNERRKKKYQNIYHQLSIHDHHSKAGNG